MDRLKRLVTGFQCVVASDSGNHMTTTTNLPALELLAASFIPICTMRFLDEKWGYFKQQKYKDSTLHKIWGILNSFPKVPKLCI